MSCFSDYLQYGVTNKLVTYSDRLKNRITPWDATRTGPAREIGREHRRLDRALEQGDRSLIA